MGLREWECPRTCTWGSLRLARPLASHLAFHPIFRAGATERGCIQSTPTPPFQNAAFCTHPTISSGSTPSHHPFPSASSEGLGRGRGSSPPLPSSQASPPFSGGATPLPWPLASVGGGGGRNIGFSVLIRDPNLFSLSERSWRVQRNFVKISRKTETKKREVTWVYRGRRLAPLRQLLG